MNKVVFFVLSFLLVFLVFAPLEKRTDARSQNERVQVFLKQEVNAIAIENSNGKVNRGYKNIPAITVNGQSPDLKGLETPPIIALVKKDVTFKTQDQVKDLGIIITNGSNPRRSNLFSGACHRPKFIEFTKEPGVHPFYKRGVFAFAKNY